MQSVVDAARLLATLHELKELVEQAMEGVRSQGKQLVEVLATVTTASSSSDVSPRKGSRELVNVPFICKDDTCVHVHVTVHVNLVNSHYDQ